jgi:C_GCAxxG_C_C family probable redox protein
MDDFPLRMLWLKAEGYCCSQIMLILALEAQGKTNTDLVRAAGGLCYGVGASGETCGALTGASCIISLYAGKGSTEETPDYRYALMANELTGWFKGKAEEIYGGLRCEDILTQHPDKRICGQIVTETYSMAMDILVAHGFDPGRGRDD